MSYSKPPPAKRRKLSVEIRDVASTSIPATPAVNTSYKEPDARGYPTHQHEDLIPNIVPQEGLSTASPEYVVPSTSRGVTDFAEQSQISDFEELPVKTHNLDASCNLPTHNAGSLAEAKSKSRQELSHRFCHILEVGGWRKRKQESEPLIRIGEVINNAGNYCNLPLLYIGGSNADGTGLRYRDVDVMVTIPHTCIITKAEDVSMLPYSTAVFLMEQDGRRPCYPLLRVLRIGCTDKLIPFIEKYNGFEYLSSEKIAKWILERGGVMFGKENIRKHGPCVEIKLPTKIATTGDLVHSIPCQSWPPSAMEWITRDRKYDTPIKEIIKKVVDTACSVVPKCNDRMDDLEWRISFLLGERILMWDLTNTQYYCFIYLKTIKAVFFSKRINEIISSFVMKTVLFWEIEETDPSHWREEDFLDRLSSCLCRLKNCVEKKCLPHYFIRENNIFTGKLSVEDSQVLVVLLSDMIEDIICLCHECFSIECSFSSCIICHNARPLVYTKERGFAKWIMDEYFQNVGLFEVSEPEGMGLNFIVSRFNSISNDKLLLNTPSYLLEDMRAKLATDVGIQCNRNAMKCDDDSVAAVYISLAEQYYKLGAIRSNICAQLHLSAFYSKQGHFDKALSIINQLKTMDFRDFNRDKFYSFQDENLSIDEDVYIGEMIGALNIEHMSLCLRILAVYTTS